MPRSFTATAALLGLTALLLAACADELPRGSPRERLVVNTMTLVHGVRFDPGFAGVPAGEAAELVDFLRRAGIRPGDRVMVERPRDGGSALTERRIAALEQLLGSLKVAVEPVAPRETAGDLVRIFATAYVPTVPGCPDWREPEGSEYTNFESQNFGCASAANLAAMVIYPRDLVAPRELGPADGEATALAVARQRIDKSKVPVGEKEKE